ncbi:MAG: DUF1449 family protein [Candidatus Competibacteraceae bacterium]|nr:DUF1449 family protein [Candidatus Competibacteraceae bacterium]
MELFLAPESWPFTMAVMLLVAIAVVEGLALLVGMSLSGWIDHLIPDAAHGVEGLSDSWLGWLHVGKVPILVLLVVLLTAFALIGYIINATVLWRTWFLSTDAGVHRRGLSRRVAGGATVGRGDCPPDPAR